MTPKSKLFQAGFSAALVIALIVTASPARAEPVTLSCRADTGSETWTLRINYATGLVEELAPSGKAYTNRVATATISPNAIIWSIDQPKTITTHAGTTHQTTEHWEGRIDRLSGTGWMENSHSPVDSIRVSFTCRQVTKPKF